MTTANVRDSLISSVVKYVSDGKNNQPLGDLYDSISGAQVANSGHARPVVGGHLALVSAVATSPAVSLPKLEADYMRGNSSYFTRQS